MPGPIPPLTGDALLQAVTTKLVALHERYHRRAPVSAKTQLMNDELLACASRDAGHLHFAEVGALSGRRVTEFISNTRDRTVPARSPAVTFRDRDQSRCRGG